MQEKFTYSYNQLGADKEVKLAILLGHNKRVFFPSQIKIVFHHLTDF